MILPVFFGPKAGANSLMQCSFSKMNVLTLHMLLVFSSSPVFGLEPHFDNPTSIDHAQLMAKEGEPLQDEDAAASTKSDETSPAEMTPPQSLPTPSPTVQKPLENAPQPKKKGLEFQPTWKPDGQSFETYTQLKDELIAAFRASKLRVVVASQLLSDGDIATALFAAKLRGLFVSVLLEGGETHRFASRHAYLAQNHVPTYVGKIGPLEMGSPSLLVIDNTAWRISCRFDEKTLGSVKIDRASQTLQEIAAWFKQPKIKMVDSNRALPYFPRAKGSTSRGALDSASAKITGNQKNRQAPLPYRLPQETRLQRLRSGKATPEQNTPVSGKETQASQSPALESDLSETP
jgi:hypothetical protein